MKAKKLATKKKKKVASPIKTLTIKRIFATYLTQFEDMDEKKSTLQVESDAIELFQDVLLEVSRWIVIEAEKLALAHGQHSRITSENIRNAVKTYLRRRE